VACLRTNSLLVNQHIIQTVRISRQEPKIVAIGFVAMNPRIGKVRPQLQRGQSNMRTQINDDLGWLRLQPAGAVRSAQGDFVQDEDVLGPKAERDWTAC